MECVCGSILRFCRDFRDGKVINDIERFKCACGCNLWIINGVVWTEWFPIDLDKV